MRRPSARSFAHQRALHVYSNLLVFDANGRIVATSNPAAGDLAGRTLSDEWVARILALRDTQGYAVSAFAPTPAL